MAGIKNLYGNNNTQPLSIQYELIKAENHLRLSAFFHSSQTSLYKTSISPCSFFAIRHVRFICATILNFREKEKLENPFLSRFPSFFARCLAHQNHHFQFYIISNVKSFARDRPVPSVFTVSQTPASCHPSLPAPHTSSGLVDPAASVWQQC